MKKTINESVWKRFESDQARRERTRLIRNGAIVPAVRMKPQLLVKDANGRWCPELVIH